MMQVQLSWRANDALVDTTLFATDSCPVCGNEGREVLGQVDASQAFLPVECRYCRAWYALPVAPFIRHRKCSLRARMRGAMRGMVAGWRSP